MAASHEGRRAVSVGDDEGTGDSDDDDDSGRSSRIPQSLDGICLHIDYFGHTASSLAACFV